MFLERPVAPQNKRKGSGGGGDAGRPPGGDERARVAGRRSSSHWPAPLSTRRKVPLRRLTAQFPPSLPFETKAGSRSATSSSSDVGPTRT
ncbi:hypothetical protein GE061_013385 [Apolygus lucorum]|uniref:Uncharacterized protein n=1 Tax=Apolygus lucorum TaxID=248454 RepID=A0A8S9XPQ7_APOLU|nr:hypothetical protein GE061_013385 [Apolygus lucorum]